MSMDSLPAPASRTAHRLALFGAVSQFLVPVAFITSWFRMSAISNGTTFSDTSEVGQIVGRIESVTSALGKAFDDLLIWCLIAVVALIPFIIAITRFKYRRRWAFWFCCLYGGAMIGTPFGLFLLIYALIHKKEFRIAKHEVVGRV